MAVEFTFVSYNIHFGVGMDDRYDLERIADEVRGADVICLQEVTRNFPKNTGGDLAGALSRLLPDYFSVFKSPFQISAGGTIEDGIAVSRYVEFGNMVLSKVPILASRNLLLPRSHSPDVLNLQRSALEALIDTPVGPVRVYSIHLDHTNPAERIEQIRFIKERALGYEIEGGAATGLASWGYPDLPDSPEFLLLGDFNMLPESPEYVEMCGPAGQNGKRTANLLFPADVSGGGDADPVPTWFDPAGKDPAVRIDYGFASASLAKRINSTRVDTAADGSDHRPVWMTMTA